MLRDYMEPPAPAIAINKQNTPHCNSPVCQVGDSGCQVSQHLLDGLQVCLPCCSENTPFNECETHFTRNYFKFLGFEMSNKNQFQQKQAHASKNHFENRQEQMGRKFLQRFRQGLQSLIPVTQGFSAFLCHKPPYQPRSVTTVDPDKSLLGKPSNGSELLMPAFQILQGVCLVNGTLQGGMDYGQLLDEDLFQLIPHLPEPNPAPTFEDFLIFASLQEYEDYASISNLQIANMDEPGDQFILTEEPCSSPSWIGAQPDPDSDCDSLTNHQGTAPPMDDNGSCAPTEIDTLSNCSSVTLPFCCPSPHSRGRKRKLHEDINSIPQSEVDNPTQEQKEIDAALAFENCSPSYCNSHTQSRADSITNFLIQHGPYPGWEFDEYPQTFDYSPTLSVCSDSTGSSCSSCGLGTDSRSRSGILNPQLQHTPPEDSFWDHWVLDSDGNLRPRPVDSPSSPVTFVSFLSDPFDQVPTQDMIEIFEGRIAQSSSMPDSPSSHASLQPMLRDWYYAAAFDDDDDDDDRMRWQTLNGGANNDFQPSKADISKLVQKLKCVDHHFAPKQIRKLLVSDQKFLKKIERTSDAKQLLSCVQAAAVRMGLQVPEAQKPKEPSSAANGFNIAHAPLPFSTKDGKGKGKNTTAPSDKGKGKGKQPNTFNSTNENVNHKNQGKGKGKGKNQDATNNAPTTAKSKGKGQLQTVTYKLEPDGRNVLPLDAFVPSHGGVYVCEKLNKLKELPSKELEKTFQLEFSLPSPWILA